MAKIDEIKEHIASLRAYLNIIIAILLTIGAGVSKLYLSQEINVLFWSGILLIILLIFVFVFVSKSMHKQIERLKDL